MSTKRYHRKSRAGCDTCKRRRVKCDEATPTCGSCAQREESCHYSQQSVAISKYRHESNRVSSPGSASPTSQSLQDVSSLSRTSLISYNTTRMKEMELIHQWSTNTYITSGFQNITVFRDYVVREGTRYPFLMDILLAFTSLHSASTAKVVDAQEHITSALHYQNQSLAEISRTKLLLRISSETCDSVLLATTLNMICALVASLIPSIPKGHSETTAALILRIRKHYFGLIWIMENHRRMAESGELAAIFDSPNVRRLEDSASFTMEKLDMLCADVCMNLDSGDAAHSVYQSTLENLKKAFADSHGRSVFVWLATAEESFFEELMKGKPAALVILMCWGTLVHLLEPVWWTQYAGRQIVEDLLHQLKGCDQKWTKVMNWCSQEVGIFDSRLSI